MVILSLLIFSFGYIVGYFYGDKWNAEDYDRHRKEQERMYNK